MRILVRFLSKKQILVNSFSKNIFLTPEKYTSLFFRRRNEGNVLAFPIQQVFLSTVFAAYPQVLGIQLGFALKEEVKKAYL